MEDLKNFFEQVEKSLKQNEIEREIINKKIEKEKKLIEVRYEINNKKIEEERKEWENDFRFLCAVAKEADFKNYNRFRIKKLIEIYNQVNETNIETIDLRKYKCFYPNNPNKTHLNWSFFYAGFEQWKENAIRS
jgi:hypothetical protein